MIFIKNKESFLRGAYIFSLISIIVVSAVMIYKISNQISINSSNMRVAISIFSAKDKARTLSGSSTVQFVAIQDNMNTCLNSRQSDSPQMEALMQEQSDDLFTPPHLLSHEEMMRVVRRTELKCTQSLLDTVVIGNPKGAAALAGLLSSKHYAVSPEYEAVAKMDVQALASVHL